MVHIVDFRVRALSGSGRSVRKRASGSAEIVIFPGVRYERWEDGQTARTKSHRVGRDLIDIKD